MTLEFPDTTPQDRHGWRWKVHHSILSLAVAVGAIGIALITGLPLLGRVAWADEQDRKIDEKIHVAIQPIETRIVDLSVKQDRMNDLLQRKLQADLDEKIVQTKILQCKAKTDDAVAYFRQRVQEFVDQYNQLTGRYDKRPPTCGDTGSAQ